MIHHLRMQLYKSSFQEQPIRDAPSGNLLQNVLEKTPAMESDFGIVSDFRLL